MGMAGDFSGRRGAPVGAAGGCGGDGVFNKGRKKSSAIRFFLRIFAFSPHVPLRGQRVVYEYIMIL